ncbi:Serine/threonine-protein kinase-like protein [Hapsidospora chrysogenum ATCC 11550]|uniref:non-specific serine/threonine protein kinase n=1 Tax=Hapsidospora chrysogenum (strain ATCC 11550 / CBS 779.69 / DSM 880 / IAM 14645 / JCM 23072 / IMI 49137) TaxID=857340 RepID=A0A086SYX4_HAPC1|nr:Serine/threonine-protein kinase-like protein [Hapsidospora chrysogenum ATCC 11550]
MCSNILNKRGRAVLGSIDGNPASLPDGFPKDALPTEDTLGNRAAGQDDCKICYTGSKVWSDIRDAIMAIGRASQNSASESYAITEHTGDETRSRSSKASGNGKASTPAATAAPTPSHKTKNGGGTTRGLVRKLKNIGPVSNNTFVLRNGQGGIPDNAVGSARADSRLSSEVGSAPLSDQAVAENVPVQRPSLGRSDSVVRRPLSKRDSQWGRPWARRNQGYPLGTIQECSMDEFQPTIVTVEKAAATKIYLETHFNQKLKRDDPKDARRQYLETQLYYSPHLTEDQKNVVRGSLWSQESCHLRETRALKSKSTVACQGQEANPYLDNYEPLRVLGKGSFGVVRLIREKSEGPENRPRQVFAMKVIRKSDMLRNSQEGHLRAERDFLVASEGSHWYAEPNHFRWSVA